MSDCHSKSAEQGVGKGNFRASSEAGLESDHRARDSHSSDKSGDNRGHKERDNDVHSGDAESQHDDDREDDCIQQKHGYSKRLRVCLKLTWIRSESFSRVRSEMECVSLSEKAPMNLRGCGGLS